MNKVRERVLEGMKSYMAFAEYKDLIAFVIGADYFTYDYELIQNLMQILEKL